MTTTVDTITTTIAWPSHFGLTHVPFTKTIAVEDLHPRDTHTEAVARIHHCIDQRSIGVICGDVGAGKSVAMRAAANSLDRTKHVVIYLANPAGGCRGIYVAVATALGATPRFHKAEAINQTMSLLAAETNERHRHVTFAIDEAHLLTPAQLEELRLLTSSDMDSSSPFALVLIGQPTLALMLRQGIFAALDQRITMRYTLTPMTLTESISYLNHHIALAGRTDPLIADDAAARLHRYANGIPRALNNAATAALLAAAAEQKPIVDDTHAKKAIAELTRN